MNEQIQMWDWGRIWMGLLPGAFFFEIMLRSVVVYFLIVITARTMGKRTASNLSVNERVGLSCLAAAFGMPIMSPDRGLLPGVVCAITFVSLQWLLSKSFTRSPQVERLSQGKLETLVKDGVLQVEISDRTHISKGRIFSQLRGSGIVHLGEVERLYIEAGGEFTVVPRKKAEPGLCIIPEEDLDFINRQKTTEVSLCKNCGISAPATGSCLHCGSWERTSAVEKSGSDKK